MHPLSLILLDVDHFKRFNDTFGHQAGDEVLRKVAHVLLEQCGEEFFCARYGGEEFTVILPGLDATQAMGFAEQVRRAVESTPCCYQPITVSLGVASVALHTLNPDSLVEEADQSLYVSKRNGRNRATHAQEAGVLITEIAPEVWQERVQNAIHDHGGYAIQQVISQIVYDHLQMTRRAKAFVAGRTPLDVPTEEGCRFRAWLEQAQQSPVSAFSAFEVAAERHATFHALCKQMQSQPEPQLLHQLMACGREFVRVFDDQLAGIQRAA